MEIRYREARRKGQALQHTTGVGRITDISPNLARRCWWRRMPRSGRTTRLDYDELKKAIELDWQKGRVVRGASTITQQLAKNLYLSPSRNPLRKLRELIIARRLEVELKKARILEIYLNVIEWGDGIYGAEARRADLLRHQRHRRSGRPKPALLAGAIVNPRRLSPANPTEAICATASA